MGLQAGKKELEVVWKEKKFLVLRKWEVKLEGGAYIWRKELDSMLGIWVFQDHYNLQTLVIVFCTWKELKNSIHIYWHE